MNLRTKLIVDLYFGGFLHAVFRIPTLLLGKVLRRDHALDSVREIAVLKLLGGGSLVIAYPALLALRRLPNLKKLTLITSTAVAPFGRLLGVFDEIIIVRDGQGPVTLGLDSLKAFRQLWRHDAIVDLEVHSRLSTVFALFTAARNRIGFFTTISFWRRHLNTHLLFCNVTTGIYQFYDQVASLFGATSVSSEECSREFRARLEIPARRDDHFQVAIAPMCSDLGRERMLRPDDWPAVVRSRLAVIPDARPVEVHLLGAPGDRNELEVIRAALVRAFGDRLAVHNHAGETNLAQSVTLLAQMDETLCIDSALLHFSRLLDHRTVSFWGPTDPATRIRPGRALDVVNYVKIPCSPCVHLSHQPPCKGNNVCMRLALDPEANVPRNPAWVLQS